MLNTQRVTINVCVFFQWITMDVLATKDGELADEFYFGHESTKIWI